MALKIAEEVFIRVEFEIAAADFQRDNFFIR